MLYFIIGFILGMTVWYECKLDLDLTEQELESMKQDKEFWEKLAKKYQKELNKKK